MNFPYLLCVLTTLSKKAVFLMIRERVSWCLCTRGNVIHLCASYTELLSYWSSDEGTWGSVRKEDQMSGIN